MKERISEWEKKDQLWTVTRVREGDSAFLSVLLPYPLRTSLPSPSESPSFWQLIRLCLSALSATSCPHVIWQLASSKCEGVRKDGGKGGDFPSILPSSVLTFPNSPMAFPL